MNSTIPLNPKHLREAKQAGIKLLQRADDSNYLIYECPVCCEPIKLAIGTVRRRSKKPTDKPWNCENCRLEKYEDEAAKANLKIVGKDDDSNYLIYEHILCGHIERKDKSAVRDCSVECKICFEQKLEEEAKIRHLRIVGQSSTDGYRLYEHMNCKHRQELRINGVSRAAEISTEPYPCTKCLLDQLAEEASNVDLVFHGESELKKGKDTYYSYAAPCGHNLIRRSDQIRDGMWMCRTCGLSKNAGDSGYRAVGTRIAEEAESVGLELVGDGSKASTKTYKFKKCGHLTEREPGNLRAYKEKKCLICTDEKVTETLLKRGLEIVGDGAKKGRRLIKFSECGHVREADLSAALEGHVRCHECGETYLRKPSNLYLLRIKAFEQEWLKLGFAKTIESRVKQYGLPKVATIDVLEIWPTATARIARITEFEIENKYKSHKLDSTLMQKYHRISGYSECYPTHLQSDLVAEFYALNHLENPNG
ncbi:hypothetical protein N9O21_04345 [Rhodobacteraceae bacterium]|nr:hypothetical protein [Paracoccaceae bacterium]